MEQLIAFKKIITIQILVLAGLVAAVALLLNYPTVAKGFVLGSFFSLLNFLVMARSTAKRLGQTRRLATASSGANIVVRLGLMAVPLYAAITMPQFNAVAAAAGLFNLQISIVIYGLVIERYGLMVKPTAEGR
jgi:hypothetical protein